MPTDDDKPTAPAPAPPTKGLGNRGVDRRRSKLLSLALRHRPAALGLSLDDNGWASVDAVLRGFASAKLSTTAADLDRVVAACDKQRFAFDVDKVQIRASQGHSISIDLALSPSAPPSTLFHGTHVGVVDTIRNAGLSKMQRHHVHLSASVSTAQQVGGRRGKVVILRVDASAMTDHGHAFFESENGVWLTDHVPPEFIAVSTQGEDGSTAHDDTSGAAAAMTGDE